MDESQDVPLNERSTYEVRIYKPIGFFYLSELPYVHKPVRVTGWYPMETAIPGMPSKQRWAGYVFELRKQVPEEELLRPDDFNKLYKERYDDPSY